MKKIYLLIFTLLILPFTVFAEEEPLFYVDGSMSGGEGYGYYFESNILDLNGYNGGQILIYSNSTEELNITVRLNGENNITVDGDDEYGIIVINDSGKANLIIEDGNSKGKLNINSNFGGIFADNKLTINGTTININSKSAKKNYGSDALITSENLKVIDSNINFVNQKLNDSEKVDLNAIFVTDKFESINSNLNATGVNNLLNARYVDFNKSIVSLKSSSYLGVIAESAISVCSYEDDTLGITEQTTCTSAGGDTTDDNYINITDSNITLDNSTGGFIDEAKNMLEAIENVTFNNSNIVYKNNTGSTNSTNDKSLFSFVGNLNFNNSNITGDSLYYVGYSANNVNVNNTKISLTNTESIFDSSSEIVLININNSTISNENNETVSKKQKSMLASENITINNSNIDFENVYSGINFVDTMNIKNSSYYYNGNNYAIYGQHTLNIYNSNIDMTSKDSDVLLIGTTMGETEEKMSINIDENMTIVNENLKFTKCTYTVNDDNNNYKNVYMYINEKSECPTTIEDYSNISKLKSLKMYPKITDVKNETLDDVPDTGSFVSTSLVVGLLIIGTGLIYVTKKKNVTI